MAVLEKNWKNRQTIYITIDEAFLFQIINLQLLQKNGLKIYGFQNNMFTVKKIDFKHVNEFIKLSYKIYKNNYYWVPQLDSENKKLLSNKNPYWKHAKKQLFLAYDEKNNIIGRIAGIIDYNYIKFQETEIGYFGFFECVDNVEVAKLLFNAVREWLAENNLNKMMGPMNPSTNDEVGFLCEGFDSCPKLLMPYTHKYYLDLVQKCGLTKIKELYAYNIPVALDDRIPRLNKALKIVQKRNPNITLKPFDKKNFKEELEDVIEVYNSAWEKNWGFVPWTREEFENIAKDLVYLADPNIIMLAYDKDKIVGMLIAVPDYNYVFKKMNGKIFPFGIFKFLYYRRKIQDLRLMIMGVKKEYRHKGIEAYMALEALINSVKGGYKNCELSWILDDNIMTQRTAEMMGGTIYKKYAVYGN